MAQGPPDGVHPLAHAEQPEPGAGEVGQVGRRVPGGFGLDSGRIPVDSVRHFGVLEVEHVAQPEQGPLGWRQLQRLRQAFGEEAGESRGIAQFSAFG